jgi:hypothetical protein
VQTLMASVDEGSSEVGLLGLERPRVGQAKI